MKHAAAATKKVTEIHIAGIPVGKGSALQNASLNEYAASNRHSVPTAQPVYRNTSRSTRLDDGLNVMSNSYGRVDI